MNPPSANSSVANAQWKCSSKSNIRRCHSSTNRSTLCLTKGYLDEVPMEKIKDFEAGLIDYSEAHAKTFYKEIAESRMWTDKWRGRAQENDRAV
jgi:F0F1-type ATP synthase alpha subunit